MKRIALFLRQGRGGRWALVAFSLVLVVVASYVGLRLYFRERLFPGVLIAGSNVGKLSLDEASASLEFSLRTFARQPLLIVFDDNEWLISSNEIGLKYNIDASLVEAYSYGRDGLFFGTVDLLKGFGYEVNFPLRYLVDEKTLEASLSAVAADIDIPRVPPSIQVLERVDPETQSRILVDEGEAGRRVEVSRLRMAVHQRLGSLSSEPIDLEVQPIDPYTGSFDFLLAKARAERLVNKKIIFSFGENGNDIRSWELGGEDLVGFLAFDAGFDGDKIASYSATLAESINRPAQNATFVFRGGRVVEFAPEKNGLELEVEKTSDKLMKAISDLEMSEQEEVMVGLPLITTAPEITTADVNDLGIKELLGRGVSTFRGSIANREHNIALSSSRISGFLVAPGETFSFNRVVGEVSAATGYRQSYIIKEGRTVLDDGGGVCQVSTTTFRAALDVGLPIKERRAHAYRVYYYEQNSKAGYDATVFAPSVDLKFINDTPAYILIQAEADTVANRLVVDIYGTSDGRQATLSNHRMWDVTPPPPDLYQDDPTLPVGTVKQVDWKAWGAKVKYDYTVEREGETIFEKTFYSNFSSWQSVFLRGTGGV
jgi:vancomycin resistance protein YoaR